MSESDVQDPGQFRLRLPKLLHGTVRAAAIDNRRSINAEIVYRLREYERQWLSGNVETRLARIEKMLRDLTKAQLHTTTQPTESQFQQGDGE